jgi:glycosyltransferase involved in cell wall biosynthesis
VTIRIDEGIGVFLAHLVRGLCAARDVEVVVTALRADCEALEAELAAPGVIVTSVPDVTACDVWVLPSVHCNSPAGVPCVVFLHDIAHRYLPDLFGPEVCADYERAVTRRLRDATLVACFSHTVSEVDLIGKLGLPADRIRTIPTAWPDLELPGEDEAAALRGQALERPYVFLPAKFRPNKNHIGLIEAVHRLGAHGGPELDLVFTNWSADMLPLEMLELVDRHDMRSRVHTLGLVDRRRLAALYLGAAVTAVPSFYEAGSYPVMEAVAAGCPVVASRIPAFIELFGTLGGAMRWCDPHDPDDMARALGDVVADGPAVAAAQEAASAAARSLTWGEVALRWLDVFREGAMLAVAGNRPAPLVAVGS